MRELTILYDASCRLCRGARAWMSEQPAYVGLRFLPAAGEEARAQYPTLDAERTLDDLTVVADDGRVWRGDAAWITCLWALRPTRAHALRLASPAMRPLARAFFRTLSRSRHASRWFDPKTSSLHDPGP